MPLRGGSALAAAGAAVLAAVWCGTVDAAPENANPATGEWVAFKVVGDGIPETLGAAAGDAARGRSLIVSREAANCVLCHAISDPGVRFSGNVGPSLDGVGRRLSSAQLRLAIVDGLRLNPATIMPSYYRIDGLDRVAGAYRGKPILDAQQIDDIVAYLATMQ